MKDKIRLSAASADQAAENRVDPINNGTETLKLLQVSKYDVFHTPIEKRFDSITRLARRSLGTPVAAITAIAGDRQWFKSVLGWTVAELPVRDSLCRLTKESGCVEIIPNLAEDPRSREHPFIAGSPGFRFYAGCPLRDGQGAVIGSFCALDLKPRVFSAEDKQVLLDLAELAQRELQSVEVGSAYSQLVAKLGLARREAMLDPLTRLWNRRGMEPLLNALLHRSDEEQLDLTVGLIDIDQFKQINDVYGHDAGDRVLRGIARRFVDALRRDDVVCRLGGDEFLAILPGTSAEHAANVSERLRETVNESPLSMGRSDSVQVTVSIGCASHASGSSSDSHSLLKAADRALMMSKAGGRNRVAFAADKLVRAETTPEELREKRTWRLTE